MATKGSTIELREVECCTPALLGTLEEADAAELAAAFAALGDPIRLRCLSLIAAAGRYCSCDLEAPLQRSRRPSATTQGPGRRRAHRRREARPMGLVAHRARTGVAALRSVLR